LKFFVGLQKLLNGLRLIEDQLLEKVTSELLLHETYDMLLVLR